MTPLPFKPPDSRILKSPFIRLVLNLPNEESPCLWKVAHTLYMEWLNQSLICLRCWLIFIPSRVARSKRAERHQPQRMYGSGLVARSTTMSAWEWWRSSRVIYQMNESYIWVAFKWFIESKNDFERRSAHSASWLSTTPIDLVLQHWRIEYGSQAPFYLSRWFVELIQNGL